MTKNLSGSEKMSNIVNMHEAVVKIKLLIMLFHVR